MCDVAVESEDGAMQDSDLIKWSVTTSLCLVAMRQEFIHPRSMESFWCIQWLPQCQTPLWSSQLGPCLFAERLKLPIQSFFPLKKKMTLYLNYIDDSRF